MFSHFLQSRLIFSFLFSFLADAATLTAAIGAGSASSWGDYQARLPKEFAHKRI